MREAIEGETAARLTGGMAVGRAVGGGEEGEEGGGGVMAALKFGRMAVLAGDDDDKFACV